MDVLNIDNDFFSENITTQVRDLESNFIGLIRMPVHLSLPGMLLILFRLGSILWKTFYMFIWNENFSMKGRWV